MTTEPCSPIPPTDPDRPKARLSGYRRLLLALGASGFGDGLDDVALPLIVLSITTDERYLGLLGFATTLPWLVVTPVAGVMVDRHDRRLVMWLAMAARGVVLAFVSLAIVRDFYPLPMVLFGAFALGAGDSVFGVASNSVVPYLVPSELLPTANGRIYAVQLVANSLVAPVAAAWLFSLAVALPLFVDAITFFVAGGIILSIRKMPAALSRARPSTESPKTASFLRDAKLGFEILFNDRTLRNLAAIHTTMMFATALTIPLYVKYARVTLGLSATEFGLLLAVGAVGGVIGGLRAGAFVRRLGRPGAIRLTLGAWATAYLAYAFLPSVPTAVTAGVLAASAIAAWSVINLTTRQERSPQDALGRVNAAFRLVGRSGAPIGALAGGFLAAEFGLLTVWKLAAVLMLVAAVAATAVRFDA